MFPYCRSSNSVIIVFTRPVRLGTSAIEAIVSRKNITRCPAWTKLFGSNLTQSKPLIPDPHKCDFAQKDIAECVVVSNNKTQTTATLKMQYNSLVSVA